MTVTELLAKFSDPNVIGTLATGDKMYAGLITTLLGMGITFSALVILQFVIAWMDKLLNRSKQKATTQPATLVEPKPTEEKQVDQPDNNELIAVIATAIAAQLKTSTDNIVIRNIEKVEDRSPLWNRAGIIEQMNNRL